MVDFAGWSMPVQYSSISEEHLATRTAAALFDVSHMGRFSIVGPDAAAWLDSLLTRRVVDLRTGRIRYSLVTTDEGGTLDDVLVYRLPFAEHQPEGYGLVVNASNRDKIWQWMQRHAAPSGTRCDDLTRQTAMIAVQGPQARALVIDVMQRPDFADLKTYTGWAGTKPLLESQTSPGGREVHWVCSRTGYTGEDGFELIVPAECAAQVWRVLLDAGQAAGVRAAGLGARDTLRLEAGMPLYGHELDEQINPIQAGLAFAVNLNERDFHGRDALLAATKKDWPKRVGLVLEGRRVAREKARVLNVDEQDVGTVTSGTFSPTLQKAIAMAYVDAAELQRLAVDRRLRVDIRGKHVDAEMVPLPFYRRSSS